MTGKLNKTQIDELRDSALSMKVGGVGDGEITEMVSVADKDLYFVNERALFRLFLADEVDPLRQNANIPNSNQRILSAGSSSEVVGRSFLTANALFNVTHFDQRFDRKQIMDLALSVTKELLGAESIRDHVSLVTQKALRNMEQPKGRSFTLPSVVNIEGQLKSFIQKLEHAHQLIYKFTKIFYDHQEKMFEGFAKKVKSEYGAQDDFVKFSDELIIFMNSIRNARHCIEHPKPNQRIIVQDFRLNTDASLSLPSIEIIHDATPQPSIEASVFLSEAFSSMLRAFESLMAHIAIKHVSGMTGFELAIGTIPEDQLTPNARVRVGYLVKLGDQWNRLG